MTLYGYVLESSKFRQRFILRESKVVSIGANDPKDLRDADESQFVVIVENRSTKKTKVLSQRFRRLSEARTVARDLLLRTRNEDIVAIIGQTLGTAEVDGRKQQIFRDVVGITWKKAKPTKKPKK